MGGATAGAGTRRQAILRAAAAVTSTTLTSSGRYPPALASPASPAAAGGSPAALAVVVSGFLLPEEQYIPFAYLLDELNVPTVLYNDGSSLRHPTELGAGASGALRLAEQEASRLGASADTPLLLVGHSRGAKECVLAAASSSRPVAAMVLLDPVDATPFESNTTLPQLEALRVPTAILGSGADGGECAPKGSNYASFYAALARTHTPRLLAYLKHAGHMAYVDAPDSILSPCEAGSDDVESVHDVALAVTAAWCAACVPGLSQRAAQAVRTANLPVGNGFASAQWLLLAAAIQGQADVMPALSRLRFRAAVEWQVGDIAVDE